MNSFKVLDIQYYTMFLVCKQDFDLVLILDKNIEDIIESDFRQRVVGNPNPIKLGRCFEFLNNWYGFKHDSTFFQEDQYFEVSEKLFHSPNSNNPSTQKELAESYGITQQTMNNYMRMANMIPELQDWVETGIVRGDTLR